MLCVPRRCRAHVPVHVAGSGVAVAGGGQLRRELLSVEIFAILMSVSTIDVSHNAQVFRSVDLRRAPLPDQSRDQVSVAEVA